MEMTPQLLLQAYAMGVFPMAEDAADPEIFWVEPERRGILPLDGLKISRRLARTVRSDRFMVKVDQDFEAIVAACAEAVSDRPTTWINAPIRALYGELFQMGHCHTVEVYQNEALVGGLYGVSLGGAFFGESMFHRVSDASKVALVHLVARLRAGGYALLDTQFLTSHLKSLGAVEVTSAAYRGLLKQALAQEGHLFAGNFFVWPRGAIVSGRQALACLSAAD